MTLCAPLCADPMTGWIEPYNCRCTNGTESECNSGQSCFWFSQGCTIGCAACDGDGARLPGYDHCPDASIAPTLNDPEYRTANQVRENIPSLRGTFPL